MKNEISKPTSEEIRQQAELYIQKLEEIVIARNKEAMILKSLPPEEEARLIGVLKDVIDERFRTLETELRRSLLAASENC